MTLDIYKIVPYIPDEQNVENGGTRTSAGCLRGLNIYYAQTGDFWGP